MSTTREQGAVLAVRRSLIEGMWHDGWKHGEIAETLGMPKNHLSVTMARMRKGGWSLPYRYGTNTAGRRVAPRRRVNWADGQSYEIDPLSRCWLWGGKIDPYGYGLAAGALAHRMSYEFHIGPIPGGMVLDHTCRQRSCVNPDHLEAVTRAENVRRGWASRAAEALIDRPRLEVDEALERLRIARASA